MFEKLKEKTNGFKVYFVSFIFCLPDLFDALGVVDLTPFFPQGMGTKIATGMAIVRITVGVTVRSMRKDMRQERDDMNNEQDKH